MIQRIQQLKQQDANLYGWQIRDILKEEIAQAKAAIKNGSTNLKASKHLMMSPIPSVSSINRILRNCDNKNSSSTVRFPAVSSTTLDNNMSSLNNQKIINNNLHLSDQPGVQLANRGNEKNLVNFDTLNLMNSVKQIKENNNLAYNGLNGLNNLNNLNNLSNLNNLNSLNQPTPLPNNGIVQVTSPDSTDQLIMNQHQPNLNFMPNNFIPNNNQPNFAYAAFLLNQFSQLSQLNQLNQMQQIQFIQQQQSSSSSLSSTPSCQSSSSISNNSLIKHPIKQNSELNKPLQEPLTLSTLINLNNMNHLSHNLQNNNVMNNLLLTTHLLQQSTSSTATATSILQNEDQTLLNSIHNQLPVGQCSAGKKYSSYNIADILMNETYRKLNQNEIDLNKIKKEKVEVIKLEVDEDVKVD